jgi:VanZ family protein
VKKFIKKYHPIPAIALGFFILAVCCIPGSDLPKMGFLNKIHADKIVHFLLYAFCSWAWFTGLKSRTFYSALFIILFMISWGAMIELVQWAFVYGRSAEAADWMADIVGVFVGAGVALAQMAGFGGR